MSKGTMNVFGCGGTGINIARHIASREAEFSSEAYAKRNVYFLDTSMSNLAGMSPQDPNVYVYEDVDGAGKNRRHVAATVMENVNPVLLKFRPAEINIVISSNSGGSGSVIAPSLVSELLDRGENVILFAINSYEDRKALENVIACMKSYESISKLRKKPVVACLFENNSDNTELAVNKHVSDSVILLSALFSRNNEGMDTQDLRNWLNYDKVTNFAPSFSQLVIHIGEVSKVDDRHLITSMILSPSRETQIGYDFIVDYKKVGYFDQKNNPNFSNEPVSYLIYDGMIETLFRSQQKRLEELNEEARARNSKRSILSDSDKAESNGLMF